MNKNDILISFTNVIHQSGWIISTGTDIAFKWFNTSVGPKEAHLYFNYTEPNEICVLLGQYECCGSNILNKSLTFSINIDERELIKLVKSYLVNAENRIDSSFARSLLLKHNHCVQRDGCEGLDENRLPYYLRSYLSFKRLYGLI